MPDMSLIRERLEQIEQSLHRIQRRSLSIQSPDDFTANEDNLDNLDKLNAVAEALQRMSQLVTEFPEIKEMDINPFMIGPLGTIPVAVDARIRVEKI